MSVTDKDLATSEMTSFNNTQLLAGECELVSEECTVDAGVLAKYTVLGRITATGKVVQLNPGASDGSQIACGVLTQPVNAGTADVRAGMYTGGFFNHEALVWPAGVTHDTLIKRQAAFARTPIRIGAIRL